MTTINTLRRILPALTLLIGAASASAQMQTSRLTFGEANGGVNYALPRTIIKADVHAVQTTYRPGEYAKFAKRLLHIDNVAQEPSTHWAIVRTEFRTEGEPDTLKYYTVKKDKNNAPLIQLSRKGLLLAINTNVEDKDEPTLPADRKSAPYVDAKQYLTEDILMATSTSKMAELTAAEILAIRESKNDIKRGQVESMPKDGPSLKIVLDELDKQEQALTRMFTGYTDTLYTARTYAFTPESDTTNAVFFRFSSKLGFVDSDDLAGEPYYISITDKHTVMLPSEKDAAKRKVDGLVYNMPSIAHVVVRSLDTTLFDRDLPIAQFGTVDVLNQALFTKGAAAKATFIPATGGLLKIDQ